MLYALGVDAVALRDEFAVDVDDVTLFNTLQGREVVFVANDIHQLTREFEARTLKATGITAIYFGRFWSKKQLWPQATWLVSKWPTIDGFVKGVERGTIAEIKQNGRAILKHV